MDIQQTQEDVRRHNAIASQQHFHVGQRVRRGGSCYRYGTVTKETCLVPRPDTTLLNRWWCAVQFDGDDFAVNVLMLHLSPVEE